MAEESSTGKKAKPQAKRRIRFCVGANIGSARYESGDTAPWDAMSAATRSAWLEQGLIVEEQA